MFYGNPLYPAKTISLPKNLTLKETQTRNVTKTTCVDELSFKTQQKGTCRGLRHYIAVLAVPLEILVRV